MAFVTKLRLASGDRVALDRVVDDITETAERKGAELTGPHFHPPETFSVPQYKRVPPQSGDVFPSWTYTVYVREMEIVGHEAVVREVIQRAFPSSVHLELSVDRRAGMGK
jgi:ribosomal protein S10